MMKNLKIQQKSGQCGVYTLANLTRKQRIIDKYGDDQRFIPSGDYELNKILKKEKFSFRVHPVVSSINWRRIVPVAFLSDIIKDFTDSCPRYAFVFILGVQVGYDEFGMHSVGLICIGERYFLTDPMFPTFVEIENIEQIDSLYQYVNSISSFVNDKYKYVSFKTNLFKELITK